MSRYAVLRRYVYCLFAASLGVVLLFLFEGHLGVGSGDEGFMWYGALRARAGDVPLRDFRSFDPGRVYWSAVWMTLFGTGVAGLRLSYALLLAPGLACGAYVIFMATRSRALTSLGLALFLVWVLRPERFVDYAWPLLGVATVFMLVRSDERLLSFAGGLVVGLAGFMGRNHGLYIALASITCMILVSRVQHRKFLKPAASWSLGVLAGYSPVLLMAILLPEFAQSLWLSIVGLVARGGTDLSLPLPWPAANPFSGQESFRQMLTSILFIGLPLTYAAGLFIWLRKRARSSDTMRALLAASTVGLFYLHYAYKRADLIHLSLAIMPWVVCAMILASMTKSTRGKRITAALALFLTLALALPAHHGVHKILRVDRYVPFRAGSSLIEIREDKAAMLSSVRDTVLQYVAEDESVLIAPYWPILYPVLGRQSPLYDTYFLFQTSAQLRERLLTELETTTVDWIVVADASIDRRQERAFRNTHRFLWDYINDRYCTTVSFVGDPDWRLMRRCDGDDSKFSRPESTQGMPPGCLPDEGRVPP